MSAFDVGYASGFGVETTDDIIDWISPPATGAWYDLAATVDNVLAILRLTDQDVDRARVEAAVPAAAALIDQYVDRPVVLDGPPPSPPLQQALEQAAIDLYRRPPATGFGSYPKLLDPVRSEILHAKQRWGVA